MSNIPAVMALHDLGRGEAEAIILAVEHPGSLVILDDRRGRLVASSLGLTMIGTLGILLIAKRRGLIQSLTQEIEYTYKPGLAFASVRISRPKCCGKQVNRVAQRDR